MAGKKRDPKNAIAADLIYDDVFDKTQQLYANTPYNMLQHCSCCIIVTCAGLEYQFNSAAWLAAKGGCKSPSSNQKKDKKPVRLTKLALSILNVGKANG